MRLGLLLLLISGFSVEAHHKITHPEIDMAAHDKTKHKVFRSNKDVYKTMAQARKRARALGLKGIHSHGRGRDKVFMPGSTHQAYLRAIKRKRNGS
tara:strand:+ start:214 stop:501 length:288 start_codon:yes stop_codon:yes gene_type:complete